MLLPIALTLACLAFVVALLVVDRLPWPLMRVVTKLGDHTHVTVDMIENLFSTDLAYLQEFYRKINEEGGAPKHRVTGPKCQHEMDIDMVTGALITEQGGSGQSGPG